MRATRFFTENINLYLQRVNLFMILYPLYPANHYHAGKTGMKRRDYSESAFEHIYQRASGRGILFYSDMDYIVFFTIVCVYAVKHNIRIVSISLMPDHFHLLIDSPSSESTSAFMRDCTSYYALGFNEYCQKSGRLWQKSYGKALKVSNKAKRTAIAYVSNNGVEKQLSRRTEGHRWNFLAYYENGNPFSEPVRQKEASSFLKKAQTIVRRYHDQNKPIGIYILERMRYGLDDREWGQLCDYVVSLYNVIDYHAAVSFYGDYETMLIALNSNTGSEYEIREEMNSLSDMNYEDIHEYLLKKGIFEHEVQNPRQLLRLTENVRIELAESLRQDRVAPNYQIRKYLHLPLIKAKK